ncbi:hypothetical protein SCLARK_001309 [Spiroplasma clarkii]|uniref:hypothetical protein n=1 Tax=Spiroplasma clarkii TaxID=2139 RepID=UPI000B5548ED|nr:hypothetical protein [Spiroplasma clarkii]ARU91845.1 hypothetical protein SCLARK_001309 [Spiroplasma clarkii]
MRYVTKAELKGRKSEINLAIDKIRKNLNYSFNLYLVGSAKRNLVLVHENKNDNKNEGRFDLDYQIRISSKNKDENTPKKIKDDFFKAFQKYFSGDEGWKCYDSTTAITIKSMILQKTLCWIIFLWCCYL